MTTPVAPTVLSRRYRLEDELGRGAMGIVYRAWDLRHRREVAVKVLAPDLSAEVGAGRFLTEIEAAARLQHPNILPLHDSGDHEGTLFYVTPRIRGESLEERLRQQGPLGVGEAVRIARDVAGALAHAHAHGVVHRDVKPGNVLLDREGHVYLADFGIARALWTETSARLTDPGAAVGSPTYMSPEQCGARDEIDGRSDIYGLGCVLYEMLAGSPPFEGENVQRVLTLHLTQAPPPLRTRRADVPPELERVVLKALAKDPSDRFSSAESMEKALREAVAEERTPLRMGTSVLAGRALAATAAFAALTVVAFLALSPGSDPVTEGLGTGPIEGMVLHVQPPPAVTFTERTAAVSPDGTHLAFSGTDADGNIGIWLRNLAEPDAELLSDTEMGLEPFWAPDSRSIGFFSGGLRIVDASGGPSRRIASASPDARGGTWNEAGTILFGPEPRSGLYAVSASGGEAVPVTMPNRDRGEIGHLWPSFLPDGEHFLFFVSSTTDSIQGIYLGSLESGVLTRLTAAGGSGVYSAGHLLYERDGSLLAQEFAPASLKLSGQSRLIVDDVATNFQHRALFSVSDRGALVYASASTGDTEQLLVFDRMGRVERSVGPARHQRNPDISPDGRFAAIEVYDGPNSSLRVVDLHTDRSWRVSGAAPGALFPTWSPGRPVLAFSSNAEGWSGLFTIDVHRTDPPELLLRSPTFKVPTDWSPDGRTLLYAARDEVGHYDLMSLHLDDPSDPMPLLDEGYTDLSAQISPSGRRLAYVSGEPRAYHVYVETFPRSGPKCQISAQVAWQPNWGSRDTELFYLNGNGDLMKVEVEGVSPCRISPAERLFRSPIGAPSQSRSHFGYIPGVDRFLFNAPAEYGASRSLHIITDWRKIIDVAQ